ncbi:MAG: hypothetical protein ABJF01_17820, partial [bacterium]
MTPRPVARDRYCGFGLSIESEIRLPAPFDAKSPPTVPDLTMRRGRLPDVDMARAHTMRISSSICIVESGVDHWVILARGVDASDRFTAHVRRGRIDVDWTDGVHEADVGRQLLGVGIAAHAYVSECACFHGSVIEAGGGTAAILGPSGAGKSTLVAGLVAAGARLVTEEVIVVDSDGGIRSGVPGVKIAAQMAAAFGAEVFANRQAAAEHPAYSSEGIVVALRPSQFLSTPLRTIGGVYILGDRHAGSDPIFHLAVSRAQGAAILAGSGYWMPHLPRRCQATNFAAAQRLALESSVQRVDLPNDLSALSRAADCMYEHIA